MKINFEDISKIRVEKYISLKKKGYKLKKIKKFRDKEKSKAYVEFVATQIKKRKDKFKIEI